MADHDTRRLDLSRFLGPDSTDQQRFNVLAKYGVKWILLNAGGLERTAFDALVEPEAIVGRSQDLVLMDAERWRSVRQTRVAADGT